MLKSLEGLPERAHVSVNARDLRKLKGFDIAKDVPDHRPCRVQVGKLRAALTTSTPQVKDEKK